MQISHEELRGWPSNMWVASLSETGAHVMHGRAIEFGESWFFEGAWAGRFADADFDLTEVVAGSGARVRDGRLVFVPPGSTRDRLTVSEGPSGTLVSNSLAGVLALSDDGLDPRYPHYFEDMDSVLAGIEHYRPEVATLAPDQRVWLCYHHNLVFDGRALSQFAKPLPRAPFDDFRSYRDHLAAAVAAVRENAEDRERRQPLALLGTCSAGYDSAAVLALATESGPVDVLLFDEDQRGIEDSGEAIALHLGATPMKIPRSSYYRRPAREAAPFFAVDGKGEDLYFLGADELLRGRLLLTGFFGDMVWEDGHDLPREFTLLQYATTGGSGLSLTEFRLKAGFVQLPVPQIGARFGDRVHAIGSSPEMTQWSVGGGYDRPIPRRILEERGVPRSWFGVRKAAASVLVMDIPPAVAVAVRRYARTHGVAGASGPGRFTRWAYRVRWSQARTPLRRVVRNLVTAFAGSRFGATWSGKFFRWDPLLMPWAMDTYIAELRTTANRFPSAPAGRESTLAGGG